MSTGSSFTDLMFSENYMESYSTISGDGTVMMIESVNDKNFWSKLSRSAAPDKKIQIKAIARTGSADGKRAIEAIYQNASKNLILAIDSDYDYSAQMDSGNSKTVNENKYIIQTFVYSKESVLQHHEVINDFASQIPLHTTKKLDAKKYLESYSAAIYGLMAAHLYLRSKGNNSFEVKVNEAIKLEKPLFNEDYIETSGAIEKTRKKSEKLKKELLKSISESEKEEFEQFIQTLKQKGITEATMYSYINGHLLENNIVKPLLDSAKKACIQFEKNEISLIHAGITTKELSDKLKSIKNTITNNMNLDTFLYTNDSAHQTPHAQKIIESIQKAFQ